VWKEKGASPRRKEAPTTLDLSGTPLTDAHCHPNVPEVYWIGAIAGRQAVSEAMAWARDAGILDEPTAQRAAAMILDENARRLYGIPG